MLRSRLAPLVAAALTLVPLPALAQANLTVYVSVGDSLAAGFSSGSLVESHQRNSVPALIARQAQIADFQQPLVSEPGLPPELTLASLVPGPVITPKSNRPGQPLNLGLARPYDNLAVPGATLIDAAGRTTDNGGLHDLILRGGGTQVAQAARLRPTFATLWIGNNDVLGAAVRGRAIPGVTLTPPEAFRATYAAVVAALRATGAQVVAANLPDVTQIPFVTTIKPYLVDPVTREPILSGGQRVPLLGPGGPLPANAYVTLAAASLLAGGVGIPSQIGGRGTPLPDEVVLDAGEVALIRFHVEANNESIRQVCAAAGVPVLDVHALLDELATTGRSIGGFEVNANLLSGGFFSLDGIHPTDLGNAIAANEWIRVINANGGTLPLVNLGAYLGVGATSRSRTTERAAEGPVFDLAAWESLLAVFPRLDGER